MSNRESNDLQVRGYFLPEDSQFRLKKLHDHMVFLSHLAQPRTHDEDETGWGPQISGDELAVCLEVLAAQAERVLDEVTWPAERVVGGDRPRARDEDDVLEAPARASEALAAGAQDDEAEAASAAGTQDDEVGEAPGAKEGDEADQADAAATAEEADAPLVFGMTMDQLDTLNRLHDRLHAYGDLVFGIERIDLADGTLTMLGDAIFEEAEAASDLMDKVAGQALPDASRRRNRVREEPAIYGVPASPGLAGDATMPLLPPPAGTGWRPQAPTRH
ncbi:hypothetical protein QFW77_15025 [Luteimonas sp. RD2P54]|uniref:XAC0095-like domain-containing protein n=1 Tax=Luteimonas endophytica TaxID=3042023 RepID=A0ABT6JBT9_9GAMM|nr:hypothetical protein [Luteimonas endophytica]MDH5824289.1 hypothetical protein [Luteimonas endophytica]